MSNTPVKDDHARITNLIRTLRYITITVQFAPFIYSILYIISLIVSLSGSIVAQRFFDSAFYASPILVAIHLVYSKILHLCVWHKTACVLPLLPIAASLVDYFFCFNTNAAILIDSTFILMFGLLLAAAYNIFFR